MGKKKCPEFENHERWLVSYADMLTLLFAVFVVLYSLNMAGEKSEQKAAGSMQESFNTPLTDIPLDRRAPPSESGTGIFKNFEGNKLRTEFTKNNAIVQELNKVISEEMNKIEMKLEERLYGPNLHRDKADPGFSRIVDIEKTQSGFKLKLRARHFYDEGAIRMKRTALKELDVILDEVKRLDRPVTIEGHTDSLPVSGKLSNWEISTFRAVNVLRHMINKKNFPPMLLSVAGYADTKPIALNTTESGRLLNRRIEIQVHYDR